MFSLPTSYDVDLRQLEHRYVNLQKQFHPDRYAGKSAQDQRLAIQYIADINQAYAALKSPLLRAQYLLSLAGVDASHETAVTRDMDFLMEQMSLREALADISDAADPFAELAELEQKAVASFNALQQEFAGHYAAGDLELASESLAKMQFYSKLLNEVEQLEHELDEL